MSRINVPQVKCDGCQRLFTAKESPLPIAIHTQMFDVCSQECHAAVVAKSAIKDLPATAALAASAAVKGS